MSSFIYPDSQTRKMYGANGNSQAKRYAYRLRKFKEARQREREKVKQFATPQPGLIDRTKSFIKRLFK